MSENTLSKIMSDIKPVPTVDLNKSNAVKIVKEASKKGMCYMKSLITPDVATELLKLEKDNRKRKKSTVKTYARYMTIGKWRLIPDPISFDTSAELMDGGHSLDSVIMSNIPSFFTICAGAPKDAKEAMDQIAPRSALDIVGFQNSRYRDTARALHAATVRSMITESPSSIKATIPKMELAEFIKTYFDSVDQVISYFGGEGSVKRFKNSSIIATVVRAYEIYKNDLEKMKLIGKFIGILTGEIRSEKKSDDAAYKLRDWLMIEMGSQKTKPLKKVIYRKTQMSLNLFLQRKTCGRLYEAQVEYFPLNMSKHSGLAHYIDNSRTM